METSTILHSKIHVMREDLLLAQSFYIKWEMALINVLLIYNSDAILKIKMAAKTNKLQLDIHPEKSYFGPV